MRIKVPEELTASHLQYGDEAGAAWSAALPALAERYLDEWGLTPDGAPWHGIVALVLPVVRSDGTKAALKLQPINSETVDEPLALRTWAGDGTVLLLDADPETGTMLLERLDGRRSLATVPNVMDALDTLTSLLRRLMAYPAPEGVRRLDDLARAMLKRADEAVGKLAREEDRYWMRLCASAVADLVSESRSGSGAGAGVGAGAEIGAGAGSGAGSGAKTDGDPLLHWDLHYENVLAGEREPWLVIDPKPLAGDPAFELLPALRNRWEEVLATGDAPRGVLRRFDFMVDALGLDPRRAAGWTLARILQNWLWEVEEGSYELTEVQHRIALAVRARW